LKVLYVEHGPLVSGGQRSLLELLRGLPADVQAEVACPPGPLEAAVVAAGVPVHRIAGTHGSFKLHPVHTSRMVLELARMALAVRRRARAGGFDVVHANSVRAGLVALLAFGPKRLRRGRGPKVVVHVRDSLPDSAVGRAVRAAVAAVADRVIAISEHTARSFGAGNMVVVYDSVEATVVHNPVDTGRFSPDASRPADLPDSPLLGVVAQITPWKGQDDAIRTLAAVRDGGVPAQLLVVGEAKFVSSATRFDNRAFEGSLHALAAELGVGEAVHFTGERDDVPGLLAALDVLLVPSWEEPFGRSIIEAMATATAVIATDQGGPPEIVTDGVDGVLLPPRRPDLWGAAASALLRDGERRAAMGQAARTTAVERFSVARHVDAVLGVYRS
jgi:glycosyltransferase involved in cell wall biosynthesis